MVWQKGLGETETREAREKYGLNEVRASKGVVWLRILLAQLTSPLVYVLFLASLISFWLKDPVDASVILAAVLMNTIFGFVQEYRAEKSMEALNKLVIAKARVKRGDEWKEIDVAMLVPGDVVKLTLGWKVPADGLLVVEDDLYLNEAILTGESMPVVKKTWVADEKFNLDNGAFYEVGNEFKGFMGAVVERGVAEMLVVKTGDSTKMGQIAKTVAMKEEKTPLQKKLEVLTGQLTTLFVIFTLLIFFFGLAAGGKPLMLLNTAVALAVAAIPEGLVVGLTVILAIGMKRILARKAVVRGLMAAETLGGVDVICLDKTGTITEGKMTAVGAVSDLAESMEEQIRDEGVHDPVRRSWLVEGALLCNDLRDPLEISMRDWAVLRLEKRVGKHMMEEFKRVDSIPFNHLDKYICTRHVIGKIGEKHEKEIGKEGDVVDFLSGAPEVILAKSKMKEGEAKAWEEWFVDLGQKGYRMVAMAMKKQSAKVGTEKLVKGKIENFDWLGLVLFEDPVRGGVAESLARAQEAGIDIKVITGDYKETAWAVIRQAGLVEGVTVKQELVMTGEELLHLATQEKAQKIKRAILFARTSPEQKLEIVQVLQTAGRTVAMMGDGVNDVPALKAADIGISVEGASDLAHEVADLVLLDNNFDTILSAVEEGRGIFENLRKVLLYLLSDSFAGMIVVTGSILLGWSLPLLATQILWINLVTDGFPYMALTVEPKEKDLLKRKPVSREALVMNRGRIFLVLLISVSAGLFSLAIFGYCYYIAGRSLAFSRTMAFVMQGISSLLYVFSCRTLSRPIWKENFFQNPALIVAVIAGWGLLASVVYWPPLAMVFETVTLGVRDWALIVGAGLGLIVIIETVKALFFRGQSDL